MGMGIYSNRSRSRLSHRRRLRSTSKIISLGEDLSLFVLLGAPGSHAEEQSQGDNDHPDSSAKIQQGCAFPRENRTHEIDRQHHYSDADQAGFQFLGAVDLQPSREFDFSHEELVRPMAVI